MEIPGHFSVKINMLQPRIFKRLVLTIFSEIAAE